MLKINHIAKTFNPGTITEKTALVDVQLHLLPGDFTTVIGGNGAGKSTMLNAVAGVFPVDKGTIEIGGVDVHAICDHGIFGNSAAGSTKFPRLYGRWMKDRKGWEKILADVGYPLAEVRDELGVPAVEQGQRVKGAFKWVYSVDKPVIETMWGWLIDYGPSGFTTLVVR